MVLKCLLKVPLGSVSDFLQIIYCFFQFTHQFWPPQHPAAATSPAQPSSELPFSGLLYTIYELSTIFTLIHQVAECQV